MRWLLLTLYSFLSIVSLAQDYKDNRLTVEQRTDDLLSKLTLQEKVMLLGYRNQAIERLGIPAYNWWSEGLHGVARAGEATIFPQAIGMAATFNGDLVKRVGTVISTEARAKYNLASSKGNRGMYVGLTYWSPNINIFRDPRWGRGQETYGEDPYLTSVIAGNFILGLQDTFRNKLKIAAAVKHFVAHSGPEKGRDYFNATVSEADLNNTYLKAFKYTVGNGVAGIMTAYNSVNGIPNSVNSNLIRNTVLKKWKFNGYIVTDCGALDDVYSTHKYITDKTVAAAEAIKAGINLDCSSVLQSDIENAIERKLIKHTDVDSALKPLLLTQMRLGMYDKPGVSYYASYLEDSLHTAWHQALAREVAVQSMVLLKNDNNILPLKKDSISSIMLVGPNAASLDAIVGSYHGVSSSMVNFVEGITSAVSKATRVEYDLGVGEVDTQHFGGIWAAGNADVTIAVVGLSPVIEGEAGDAFLSPSGGDKKDLHLPTTQIAFLKALRKAVNKPIIAVVTTGSAVDINEVAQYADAVIVAWYAGEQGGNALADIVFGKVSPSGRLPVTFYNSIEDLPPFENYSMQGRTYRYFKGKPQFPFGFGLSYSSFKYDLVQNNELKKRKYSYIDTLSLTCTITNIGSITANEVIQAYVEFPQGDSTLPIKELVYFDKKLIESSSKILTKIEFPIASLMKWDTQLQKMRLYPGKYTLHIAKNAQETIFSKQFEVK